jgi:signal transduction histidine kinase
VRCEFTDLHGRLPPQHETAVFRVVQEAMNNIARHAGAESVLIQGAVRDGRLTVEIEDDGKGFTPSAIATPVTDGRGWGLLGMRERVEMLGGTLRVDSAEGRGTHVILSVPLEASWTASAS